MRLDGSTKKSRNRTGDGGFGLLESLIAIAILTTVSLGVAQLFAVALLANRTAKDKTSTSVLALEKMEQLRCLTWGFAVGSGGTLGAPVSDSDTNYQCRSAAYWWAWLVGLTLWNAGSQYCELRGLSRG